MEAVNGLAARMARLPISQELLERTNTKKTATLSHYLQKCALASRCIRALQGATAHPFTGFTESMRTFRVKHIVTLPPRSVAYEYPQDMETWMAQFSSWLSDANMILLDTQKRDQLIEMAKERTAKEGRLEHPYCECTLIAWQDQHWFEGALHSYIGTSTESCLFCILYLGAYRNFWYSRIQMRGWLGAPWKIPTSWVFISLDDDTVHDAAAGAFFQGLICATTGELARKRMAKMKPLYPWFAPAWKDASVTQT
ncbi:hypothetical protein BOTBODRAFT_39546 [Botryobasidium botryosum FD-172 SS1]|uniref:Uncharacterized protein n=1 Tax=Botryobasidium botryosum (strain FD-172 SS1) TaxID=930990 RepID=A0A067LW46_BOTB1|nr:hypothetical protein BOTBODRAFT_39546 [Botryobasidium botryosum FD-172 SS1]